MPLTKLSRRWESGKKVFGLIFLIAVFFALFFLGNNFFAVKKIRIVGLNGKRQILGLEELRNKNIFFVDPEKTGASLAKKNPGLKQILLNREYPDGILLSVVEETPISSLKVDQGFFHLAADGRILYKNKIKEDDYPIINYYQKLNYFEFYPGENIKLRDILASLFFLSKAEDLGLTVDTIDINGFNMIGLNLKDKKILFSTEKDLSTQAYQMNAIIQTFKVDGKDFSVLDLRFDKPFIKVK